VDYQTRPVRRSNTRESCHHAFRFSSAKEQSALPIDKDTILIIVERQKAIDLLQSVQGLPGEVVTGTTSPSKKQWGGLADFENRHGDP
jgi:hypothetical protein